MTGVNLQSAGRDFVASCYEVLLGREVDVVSVVEERGRWPAEEVLQSFLSSGEFEERIYQRLKTGRSFDASLFSSPLRMYHRYWIIDRFPLSPEVREQVKKAISWRDLLGCLISDEKFMGLSPLPVIRDVPLGEIFEPEDGPEPFIVSVIPFDPRRYRLILKDPFEIGN